MLLHRNGVLVESITLTTCGKDVEPSDQSNVDKALASLSSVTATTGTGMLMMQDTRLTNQKSIQRPSNLLTMWWLNLGRVV